MCIFLFFFFPQDDEFPKINDSILPTFFPFEASSPEPGDEDVSTEKSNGGDGTDEVYSLDLEALNGRGIPVLLTEEMLAQLIKASEEEQHGVETDEEDSDEDDIGKVVDTNVESVEITTKSKKHGEEREKQQKEEEEEVGSSMVSEIPVDLDYAADSVSTEIRNSKLEENKPLTITFGEEEKLDNELPTVMEDYDTQPNEDYEDPKDERDENLDQAMPTENLQDKQILPNVEIETSNTDEDHESRYVEEKTEDKEEGDDTNESVSHFKEKLQTQRESKSLRKGQSDQVLSAEVTSEHSQDQEAEITFKRRGKWVRLKIIRHLDNSVLKEKQKYSFI